MRGFRYPLTRRRPQPQRGGRRQPGATPRGPATASYASPERAAQDLRGGMCGQAWLGWSALSGLGLVILVGRRTSGLRPGLPWFAPLGRRMDLPGILHGDRFRGVPLRVHLFVPFVAWRLRGFVRLFVCRKDGASIVAKGKHAGARAAMFDPVLPIFASRRLERRGREKPIFAIAGVRSGFRPGFDIGTLAPS
jgi:hypothetical protein